MAAFGCGGVRQALNIGPASSPVQGVHKRSCDATIDDVSKPPLKVERMGTATGGWVLAILRTDGSDQPPQAPNAK